MKLLKFIWKSNCIDWKTEVPTSQGEDITGQQCSEAPVKVCDDARAALVLVIASAMELPLHWLGSVNKETGGVVEGTETVKPYGIIISHTKAGTRSAQVLFTKRYRTGKVDSIKTPMVQFDQPSEGENEECGFAEGECCALNSMVEYALAYIGGVRQQMTLKFISHGSIPQDENEADEGGLSFNENADPALVAAVEKQDAERAEAEEKQPVKKPAKKRAKKVAK